jgi:hypothetical protein
MSQAGQAAGGGTAGQAAGGGNQPAVGARNPGKQRQNQILNYDDAKDLKFYKSGTASLEGDEYDGRNLSTWLKILQAKAKQYNWMNILLIDVGNPPVQKSLIQHYGEITRSQVRQHALTYLGTGNRHDQNSDMMFNCLRKSVTKEVLDTVFTEPERYTFTVPGDPEPLEDGPSFLKAIIDHTYTNTLANTAKARENLVSLREYMEALPDSNITEFNKYVKKQMETLAAGGETTNDLITNLFKGYSHAKDKDFREWIKAKKRAYFDKTFNIHPNCTDFMELVENYYKDACTAGEWMQPDDEQRTILALKAEISQMKVRSKNKRQHDHSGGRQPKSSSSISWKDIPPKEGEPKKKKFKGKTYYWCYNHKQWTIHKPEECRLKGKRAEEDRKIKKGKGKKHALKMRVYEAALQDSSDSDDKESDSHSDSEEQSSGDESYGSNTSS